MENYAHITKMEHILDTHTEKLQALNALLDFIDTHYTEYQALLTYYYSEQRNRDLDDEENGLIPQDLKRGVLSEDAIFDLIGDYYDVGLRMLEVAHKALRHQ